MTNGKEFQRNLWNTFFTRMSEEVKNGRLPQKFVKKYALRK